MSERKIKQVENNISKQRTYAKLLGRYKLAVRNEFYFEAMIIIYAMLEDRLQSILYHTGVVQKKTKLSMHNETKCFIQNIVDSYPEKDKNASLDVKNITGKLKIIKAMLHWVTECENVEDKYLVLLKSSLEEIDIGAMIETIEYLKEWLKYRNEVIHASMNKDIDCLFSDLPERVEEGMRYARIIDNQAKILKKNSKVRKKMNLGND